jgi:S1-C subfamily serine protease
MIMRGSYLGEQTVSNRGRILILDALVWQGSSGSPAFDRYGHVVGVVFAKANIPGIFLRSGQVADDRTFAVPARALTAFLLQHDVKPVTAKPDSKPLKSEDALVRINCLP